MITLTDETVYRFGYPFGRIVEIVKVSVDFGSTGYTCWGYRLGQAEAVPGPLSYDELWITPGDALNAAHEERENLNRQN